MLILSLYKWWYSLGWRDQYGLVRQRLSMMADFFSLGLTLRTFFSPFKQIDADRSGKGSFDVMLRAMLDRLFSRLFGAVVRSFLILFGCVELLLEVLVGLLRLILWPLIPLAPVLLLIAAMTGWTPGS